MGAWGTAIFSDDTALDIRDEWREAILAGLDPGEATSRLLESFDDHLADDEEVARLFWIALAATQFETGRLLPEVRDRALAIIERGGDVDRWEEDGDEVLARQRARVLERLAAKLRGPQPKAKRLRRTPSYSMPFDVGDAIRVVDEDDGDEALVLVVGHLQAGSVRTPVVAALDWDGGEIPDRAELAQLPILPDPYAPDRLLLIDVFTHSRKDAFGPSVGEVVAKGITPSARIDPDRFARSTRWGNVAASVVEARTHARA